MITIHGQVKIQRIDGGDKEKNEELFGLST